MPLVTTASVVLQAFAYGDTSKILRLLTRTHGVQSVIAKGALRPRSQFGGVLEPFTEGSASFHFREGRELHTLSGFDLTWNPQRLGRDLVRFGGASLLAEIVLRTASEQPDVVLHDAFRHAMRRIADTPEEMLEVTALAETWSLIDRLGFAPALDACMACGRAIGGGETVSFDYSGGGVHCDDCSARSPGRPLPAPARAALLALTRGETPALARTGAHWRLLARYLSHHVVEGVPLHALAFLAEALGEPGGEGEART